MYLNELRNKYPRYIRDQLSLIKKCTEIGSLEVIDEALALCLERQLFSANDFQDVVSLFKRQRLVNSVIASDQQFDSDYNDIAELTLAKTEANQRPLEDYFTIMESAK